MTANQTQRIGHEKYPTYAPPRTAKPIFHPFRSTINHFQVIAYFKSFPSDCHVKISKCHKMFRTLPIANKCDSLCSTVVANVLKVWMRWHGNCRRSSILQFPASYSPVLTTTTTTKIKCHKLFSFASNHQKINK